MNQISREKISSATLTEQAGLACRFCGSPVTQSFVDLGLSPLCQKHTHVEELNQGELFFPLHAFV